MIRAQPGGRLLRFVLTSLFALAASVFGVDARADVIDFTGNVAADFTATTAIIPGQPGSVAESSYIIRNGWTSGFIVESIRFGYDKPADTMFVGVQTYSIAGDADGNGNPGNTDSHMAAAGGVNFAHFGGDKSLTLAFANVSATGGVAPPSFVAGIPADKLTADASHTNGFTVATYNDTGSGLAYSYGTILQNHAGSLAVDPSASAPNFEFALTNFSKIIGFNPSNGFFASLCMGSQRAVIVGKQSINWTRVAMGSPQNLLPGPGPITPPVPPQPLGSPTTTPEPTSVALSTVGAIGLVAASRRRLARAS